MKYCSIGKIIRILLTALFLTLYAEAEEWQTISEMPVAVKGAQAAAKDSLIYVLGGYTDLTYEETNIIQVYNPARNTWSVSDDTLYNPRYGHIGLYYRHEMVLFGGVSENDSSLKMWNFSDPVYQYDFNANFNRKFASAQISGNDLYMFGGYQPGYSQDDSSAFLPFIAEYSIPTSSFTYLDWENYAGSQNPVQQISVINGDYIFVMGGALNGIREDIYRFDINGHTWEKMSTSLNDERAAGAAVMTIENRFAVIGGYNENADALASVEEYEDFGGVPYLFRMLPELNTARAELAAVCFDSSIYVFGGRDVLGNCLASAEKFKIEPAVTDIAPNTGSVPDAFKLFQNYPNPFNPGTVISYQLPSSCKVILEVYNLLGERTASLVNKIQPAGRHSVSFDGAALPSGVYFYRLQAEGFSMIKKMVLAR